MNAVIEMPSEAHAKEAVETLDKVTVWGTTPSQMVHVVGCNHVVALKDKGVKATFDDDEFELGGNGERAEIIDAYESEDNDE